MTIAQRLLSEIDTAPFEIRQRFKDLGDEILFNGFIFKDNRVFCRNIYLFDLHNNLKADPLEITEVFYIYEKSHSVIYLTNVILNSIRNYYKDCEFTFYITPLIATYFEESKPKLKYEIEKHRGRYTPFITSNKKANMQQWCNLLCSAIENKRKDARRKWS